MFGPRLLPAQLTNKLGREPSLFWNYFNSGNVFTSQIQSYLLFLTFSTGAFFFFVQSCFAMTFLRALHLSDGDNLRLDYAVQLVLSCLMNICQNQGEVFADILLSNPIAKLSLPDVLLEGDFNVELIVECVRLSTNPQTHQHALVLLNTAASLFPVRRARASAQTCDFFLICVGSRFAQDHAHFYVHGSESVANGRQLQYAGRNENRRNGYTRSA